MNRDQVRDSASGEKEKGAADDNRTEQKGKPEKHDSKDGSVLKEINDDTRKEAK